MTQLRRQLGLRDVTLLAITAIFGTRWIPLAASVGMSAITLWIAAALFFGIPLALTVGTLTARQPEAGGLYVWARDDFGPWPGFLCFWLYWMGIVCWFPGTAMFT